MNKINKEKFSLESVTWPFNFITIDLIFNVISTRLWFKQEWLDSDLIPRLLQNFENWKFLDVHASFRDAYPLQFWRENIRVF